MRYDAHPQVHKEKRKKNRKIQILKYSKSRDVYHVFFTVSFNIKLEGSSWKIDFRNTKNA